MSEVKKGSAVRRPQSTIMALSPPEVEKDKEVDWEDQGDESTTGFVRKETAIVPHSAKGTNRGRKPTAKHSHDVYTEKNQ